MAKLNLKFINISSVKEKIVRKLAHICTQFNVLDTLWARTGPAQEMQPKFFHWGRGLCVAWDVHRLPDIDDNFCGDYYCYDISKTQFNQPRINFSRSGTLKYSVIRNDFINKLVIFYLCSSLTPHIPIFMRRCHM